MVRYTSRTLIPALLIVISLALTTCGKDSPTEPQTPARVSVTPSTVTLVSIGQTAQLSATILDRQGTVLSGFAVTWASSDATIARVNQSGLVTALRNGSARITATSGGTSGQATVTVALPVATMISVSPDTVDISAGQTAQLSVSLRDRNGKSVSESTVMWSSSNESVATVSTSGLVTAHKSGVATVRAASGQAVGSTLVLVDIPASLKIVSDVTNLSVGQTTQLSAVVLDRKGRVLSGASVTWSSDYDPVASVDDTGKVTAVSAGYTIITARSGDLTRLIGISVVPEVHRIHLSVPSFLWIETGDTIHITAQAQDADGNAIDRLTYEWMSSNTSVATVDQSGLVVALEMGLTIVSVTSGGTAAQVSVTVVDDLDRTALSALYNATNGDAWTNRTGWLSSASTNDWYGVTTDESGRVTGIELGNNNLSGSIPSSLANLTHLALLDLRSNHLTGTVPPELGDNAALDRLYLNDNPLTGTVPIELTRLDLNVLWIDETQICVPEHSGFAAWLQGIGDVRHPGYCENPDREVLIAVFQATNGPTWQERDRIGWLSDLPLDQWQGVTTDQNGRVSAVDLSTAGLKGTIPSEFGKLTFLKVLELGSNFLIGKIPPALGNLTNLEHLSLHNNELSGPLPPELGDLSSLKSLVIYYNETLDGPIPPEFGKLANLEELHLGGNALKGPIPVEFGNLSNLKNLSLWGNNLSGPIPPALGALENLEDLLLGENDLDGTIPPELGNLTNLSHLFLGQNGLTGTVPAELGQLHKLEFLALDDNALHGKIPSWAGNLTGLRLLVLHSNRFSDSIPPELGNLDKLENLNFSNNQLTGSIPPELGSMRSLAGLNLSNNRLSGSIPSELGNLPVIRWFLDLSSNELSGSIPQSLGSLSRLRELYLHDNKLSGLVPLSLSRLEVLETLRLDGTNLCVFPDGEFQAWLEGIPNLSLPPACDNRDMGVLVSLYNATNGSNWTHSDGWLNRPNLNDWFGVTVNADGRVTRVSLSNNSLSGTLPLELGYLDQLTELHLNVNNLSGSIPESFGNLTLLRSLNLSHNLKLQGPLPIEMIDLSNLNTLMLEGTDLCVLPDPDMQAWLDGIPGGNVHPCQIHDRDALIALYEATNGPGWGNNSGWTDAVSLGDWYGVGVDYQGRVTAIDLSRNGLSGQLPRVLGALSELQFLRLDKNKLTGHIPSELADLNELTHILLNENQLSGPIPPELGNLNKLTHLSLSENQLSGPIPPELVSLNDLNKLILHNNRLSGPIPPDLGVLDQLTELSLYNNELTGPVPSELGRLTGLTKLPLHDNQLSGPVPAELGNLSELMELTLYNNPDLSGPIPGSLTNLDLKVLQLGGTQLCAPQTPKFSEWLLGIPDQRVAICTASMNVRAYLVQAVQSLDHPVPLIAGERALLRVFLTANGEVEIRMPKVRANFYLDDVLVHTDEIPGKETVIPAEIEEGSLSSSAIAEVPATVIQPGLEMVIEVDPDGTLDPVYGVSGRFPETGSYEVDVASVPPLNLTVVPFLWRENPDLSVLSKTGGLTSQDELFWQTRYLLPVYDPDFTVTVRDYVWTSVDPVFENISSIIRETRAIQMADGAKNHYMGVLRDIVGGQTTLRGTVSAVPLSGETIAHELGHNMSLEHAPCCFLCLGLSGVDPHYPYSEGNIGAWGYDFTGLYLLSMAGLVRPRESDLMSYCGSRWISDYHFTKALRYRVTEEVDNIYGTVASNRSLLLWGGVDENGDLVLEPAFVVDTTPSWPSAPGPYRLTGEDRNGHVLFELGFDIYEYAHGDGGSFAFAIPVDSSWPDRLSRITLSGPAGAVSIDGQGESAMGLLTDSVTGQVRGFHRDLQGDEGGISARRVLPEPGLDVVISRGVPDSSDW